MRRVIFLVLAVALLGAACNRQVPVPTQSQYSNGEIHLAGRSVSYELADDPIEQQKGLSGRNSIEENQGMLFLFPTPDFPAFWMKGMNFPIDIAWIRGNEIIDISTDIPIQPGVLDHELKTYSPRSPADWVLELKAGWASRNGLKIGDKVEIIQFEAN
jgi:uncharacterized protein